MALITPDLSEATKPISAGTYPTRIVECEPTESKAGKKMLKWALEIFDAEDSDLNGKRVYTRTMLEGKGIFKTQEIYKAATGENLENAFDTDMLVGKEVVANVIDGTDMNGNPSGYPEVKAVSALK